MSLDRAWRLLDSHLGGHLFTSARGLCTSATPLEIRIMTFGFVSKRWLGHRLPNFGVA